MSKKAFIPRGSFTDADFKRLKDLTFDYRDGTRFMWAKGPEIQALLARLEAAEKFVLNREHLKIRMEPKERELLEAWRKASGKSE